MLKAVLNDKPEEALAAFYEERDGKFFLQVEPVALELDGEKRHFALEDTGGLRKQLSDRKERHDTSRKKVDALEAEIESLQAKLEKMRDAKPDEKIAEQHRSELEQLTKKHERELERAKERERSLLGEVKRHALDAAVDRELAGRAKDGVSAKLLRPHVLSALEMREEDGTFSVVVKGDDGNPRLSQQSGSTDRMGVGEFIDELSKDDSYAVAFKGSSAAGSGAASTGGASRTATASPEDAHLSASERLKRYRETQGA